MSLDISTQNWSIECESGISSCSFSYSKTQWITLPFSFGMHWIWNLKLLYFSLRSPSITMKVIELFSLSTASILSFAILAFPSASFVLKCCYYKHLKSHSKQALKKEKVEKILKNDEPWKYLQQMMEPTSPHSPSSRSTPCTLSVETLEIWWVLLWNISWNFEAEALICTSVSSFPKRPMVFWFKPRKIRQCQTCLFLDSFIERDLCGFHISVHLCHFELNRIMFLIISTFNNSYLNLVSFDLWLKHTQNNRNRMKYSQNTLYTKILQSQEKIIYHTSTMYLSYDT